jgi:hypothetical protein
LEKLDTLEQEASDRVKKVRDQKWKGEYRMKHQVMKAFEWEETTANPVLLQAVCAFWAALSVPLLEDDDMTTVTASSAFRSEIDFRFGKS